MNERLKQLQKKLGLTQTEFGEFLTMSQNHITRIEKGERELTDKNIKLICTINWPNNKQVNENWLRNGSGEMFLEKDANQEFAEAINQINFHGDELIKKIIIDYMHLNDENRKKAKQYILDLAAAVKKDKSI